MTLSENILQYIEQHSDEAYALLLELAQIPSPSNHEEKRAAFCLDWLQKQGAQGVHIDEALNVVYPIGCTADNPVAVFMAHSDVVFPDTAPLPLTVEDGRIKCPGAGDDTANVAALLMAAKYIAERGLLPAGIMDRQPAADTGTAAETAAAPAAQPAPMGVVLVINSGEEGLGNLKGSRKILETYRGRVAEFVTFDGGARHITNRAVGSKRYKIEIDTEGGHSYGSFGNRNAIAYMASLIDTLYTMKVPPKGKTTYNVGTISGGTSVNTIAQHAEMLYEFRSDERESLAVMEQHLNAAIDFYRTKGISVTVTCVGDRPCSGEVDPAKENALMERGAAAIRNHYGYEVTFSSGSTDCNIPLSLGIPSICVGCVEGGGAHTREEYVEIASLKPGIRTAFELVLHHF